jgi:hypothetical protein
VTAKGLLVLTTIFEGVTAIALIIRPQWVVQLLLGVNISGRVVALSRGMGAGLLCLAFFCWPSPAPTNRALVAMLIYNFLAAASLAYLCFATKFTGILLIPAFVLHGVFTVCLAVVWLKACSVKVSKR